MNVGRIDGIDGRGHEGRRVSTTTLSVLLGLLLGLLVASAFWAGHYFWPSLVNQAVPAHTTSPAQALPSKPHAIHGVSITETTIADVAAEASRSVVNIDTRTTISGNNSDSSLDGSVPFHEFPFFFGPGGIEPFGGGTTELQHTGSGVITRSDGYIMTNNHVIRGADEIKVTLNDKREFTGKVVGRDPFTDVAIIKINASNLPVAKLGTAKTLRPGDWAIAIGSPMGFDHSVTLGIISAINRSLADLRGNVDLIQTDAAINPGNSGGPLLDIHGDVIGINTAIQGNAQNIGFAIPVDTARQVANQLVAHGTVAHPYVGIYMQDLNPNIAKSLGLPPNTRGAVAAKISSGSPAEKAGINMGDVIEQVDGKPVSNAKEVQSLVRAHKIGDMVSMLVHRNQQNVIVKMNVVNYPAGDAQQ
jgi:S1-C subfamily serine protease